MRGALLVLAIGAAALGVAASARSQPSPPSAAGAAPDDAAGFDHLGHEGAVTASATAAPPCTRCHAADAAGRLGAQPGHAACFGDCHGPAPARGARVAVAPERQALCTVCHRPTEIARLGRAGARAPARPAPPRAGGIDGELATVLSHAAHAGVARGCRACHGVPPEPARRGGGHPRCASCHTGRAGAPFSMTRCQSCHSPAVGPVRAPHIERGRFAVTARFSHRAHVGRVRGAGDACAGCHAAAAAATTDVVPAPSKPSCAPCHDGRAAFSLTEAACR
ncbi:MAG TPA: cytochrome c3 family protein, partial [Kofleriaceae bacterium]|nr:cytochrome c3 family protein [Kofleriaceae bacterium]